MSEMTDVEKALREASGGSSSDIRDQGFHKDFEGMTSRLPAIGHGSLDRGSYDYRHIREETTTSLQGRHGLLPQPSPIPPGGGGSPTQNISVGSFSVSTQKVSGVFYMGVYKHSQIRNTGKKQDWLTVAKVLTSITPGTGDAGWFAISSYPSTIYVQCTCGAYSGWASNTFYTAQTIALNSAADIPDGGLYEQTYDAGTHTGTPHIARFALATAFSETDIALYNAQQLMVKPHTVTALDSTGSNALAISFPCLESV